MLETLLWTSVGVAIFVLCTVGPIYLAIHPGGLLSGVRRQIRELVFGGDRVAHRALSMLELEPQPSDALGLSGRSADGLVQLHFSPLTGSVVGAFAVLRLAIVPHGITTRFGVTRELFARRLDEDLREIGVADRAADVLRDHMTAPRFASAESWQERCGDRDLDKLINICGDQDHVLWLLRDEMRAALLGLLNPRDGVRWHSIWFDEHGLHGVVMLPEAGGKLTPSGFTRPIHDALRVLTQLAAGPPPALAPLIEQVERAQAPGYRERCAQLLMERAPHDPLVSAMLDRCLAAHQPVELRMLGFTRAPERLDDEAQLRLLLECAMSHSREAARDAAISARIARCGPSLIARKDIPQFMRLRLIDAAADRWDGAQLTQALSPQVEAWTALERYEFAREADQRGWRWALPLIEAALGVPGLSDSLAALLVRAFVALGAARPEVGAALVALALNESSEEGVRLAALDALVEHGDEAALRALLARPLATHHRGKPLPPHVLHRHAATLAALQQRAGRRAMGALTLASDDDATGALSLVHRGDLELIDPPPAPLAQDLPNTTGSGR